MLPTISADKQSSILSFRSSILWDKNKLEILVLANANSNVQISVLRAILTETQDYINSWPLTRLHQLGVNKLFVTFICVSDWHKAEGNLALLQNLIENSASTRNNEWTTPVKQWPLYGNNTQLVFWDHDPVLEDLQRLWNQNSCTSLQGEIRHTPWTHPGATPGPHGHISVYFSKYRCANTDVLLAPLLGTGILNIWPQPNSLLRNVFKAMAYNQSNGHCLSSVKSTYPLDSVSGSRRPPQEYPQLLSITSGLLRSGWAWTLWGNSEQSGCEKAFRMPLPHPFSSIA